MNWITINSEEEVERISKSEDYAIIYKHSPRCMTSLMAYRKRLLRGLQAYSDSYKGINLNSIKDAGLLAEATGSLL